MRALSRFRRCAQAYGCCSRARAALQRLRRLGLRALQQGDSTAAADEALGIAGVAARREQRFIGRGAQACGRCTRARATLQRMRRCCLRARQQGASRALQWMRRFFSMKSHCTAARIRTEVGSNVLMIACIKGSSRETSTSEAATRFQQGKNN